MKKFAIILLALALVPAAYVFVEEVFFPESLSLIGEVELIALGATLATIALFLLFNDRMEIVFEQTVQEFVEDIADDIDDVQNLRLTPTQLTVVATILTAVLLSSLILEYRKMESEWHGIPVILVTAVAVVVVSWIIFQTHWFHNKRYRTPTWAFFVPLTGIILSTWLGIHFTEPIAKEGDIEYQVNFASPEYAYRYEQTRIYAFLSTSNEGASSSSFRLPKISLPSCTGDDCGYFYLALALIAVTIILVLTSAFVAHFWFLAGWVFIAIMAMIAVHELRVRPELTHRRNDWN